jgi:LCP family protein required for cell wall assembly
MTSAIGRPRRWVRLAAGVAAGLVLATSGVGWAAIARYSDKITQLELGLGGGSVAAGEPVTMLLVASDDHAGLTHKQKKRLHLGYQDYGQHTDTMMLVHISAAGDSVSVVSLPRDTLVTIPEWTSDGKTRAAHRGKLNEAYAVGGPKLMIQTVEDITGVRIDHYAEVNFAGFLTMVDALGGVEICLPKATKDKNSGLDLPAGRQTVSGAQALAYVRARYIDPTADLGRMQRQQKFVGAMAAKALSAGTLLNPLKLDAFLSAASSSLTTDDGLGRDQQLDLAERLKGVSPSAIQFTTVPLGAPKRVEGIGDVLTWDKPAATALFDKINDDQPLSTPAGPKVTVAPGDITLRVLNGTDIGGLGGKAATDLAAVGFAMSGPAGNAAEPVGATTVIRYDSAQSAAARTVAAALPGATLEAADGLGKSIEVVVGSSYSGATKVTVKKASGSGSSATPRSAADDLCG